VTTPRDFELVERETIWTGRIIEVRVERFRHADGEVVEREVVHHEGAVGIVAHDDEHVWLVRQPREAVNDPDVLEIPAGRLDVPGEPPLETARRELAEEVGLAADDWQPITSFYSTVGFSDEVVHLFRATALRLGPSADSGENERIEIVRWPLDRLDEAIATVRDSKTLIGLQWLRWRLAGG